MDFSYRSEFGGGYSAYSTLLNDCMRGDATLFDRADGLEAAWALVDPILQAWSGAQRLSRLRRGKLGPARSRRTSGARWTTLAQTVISCRGKCFPASWCAQTPWKSGARPRAASWIGPGRPSPATANFRWRSPAARRPSRCIACWPRRSSARRLTGRACICSGETSAPFLPTIPTATTAWRAANFSCACPFRPTNVHRMEAEVSPIGRAAHNLRDRPARIVAGGRSRVSRFSPVASGTGRRRPHRFSFSRREAAARDHPLGQHAGDGQGWNAPHDPDPAGD